MELHPKVGTMPPRTWVMFNLQGGHHHRLIVRHMEHLMDPLNHRDKIMDYHRAPIVGAPKVILPTMLVEPDLLPHSANLDPKVVLITSWGRHKAIYLTRKTVVHH